MSNIQFAENIISINLENAMLKLEDSESSKQLEFRSGICYGMAKMLHELGYLNTDQYTAYNEQILHIHKVFKEERQ